MRFEDVREHVPPLAGPPGMVPDATGSVRRDSSNVTITLASVVDPSPRKATETATCVPGLPDADPTDH